MKLQQKITQDLKTALKEKDAITLSVLRMLNSAIFNESVAKKKKDKGLIDQEIIQVISRQIKQRKDSIEQYSKGGRNDLVKAEKQELGILEKYMPEQMSEDEVREVVKGAIDSGLDALGPLMGKVMGELKGKADGGVVKRILDQELEK